ncbi:SPOSA6832_02814, partial [Sporobolomyces salmonicolor]
MVSFGHHFSLRPFSWLSRLELSLTFSPGPRSDVNHDLLKTRIAPDGKFISAAPKGKELTGDAERIARQKADGYCGTCYGGTPPTDGANPGCCNTCDEVREAYVRRGWSFVNPDSVEQVRFASPSFSARASLTVCPSQCVSEGWTDKIKEQSDEGCNIAGRVHVNKVIGNFHLSPGRSFQANAMHVHDLVPYLQGGNKHDFGHEVHHFSFGSETEDEFFRGGAGRGLKQTKRELGIVNPLDGIRAHTEESNYMFQYFLKVVSTQFSFLDGRELKTHQYSVTQYERDCGSRRLRFFPSTALLQLRDLPADGDAPRNAPVARPLPHLDLRYRWRSAHHCRADRLICRAFPLPSLAFREWPIDEELVGAAQYAGRNRLKTGNVKTGLGFASASGKML